MRRLARGLAVTLTLTLVGCGALGSTGSAQTTGRRVTIEGSPALVWGDGDRAVVLAHGASYDAASWEAQARAIARQGTTVLAVEDIASASIARAVRWLRQKGHRRVALVGGSAGADAILRLAAQRPDLPDQLVLISPNAVVDGLGDEPKLFIASKGDPVAHVSRELAQSATGNNNRLVILPGSAHAQGIFESDQADRTVRLILDRLAR